MTHQYARLCSPKMTSARLLGMAARFDDVTVTKFPVERNGFFRAKKKKISGHAPFSVDMDAALDRSIIPG